MANTTTKVFRNLCLLTLIYITFTKITQKTIPSTIHNYSFLANNKHYNIFIFSLYQFINILLYLFSLYNVKKFTFPLPFHKTFCVFFRLLQLTLNLGCCFLHCSSSGTYLAAVSLLQQLPVICPYT